MNVRVALAFAVLVAVAVGGCGGDDPSPTAVPTVPPPSGSSSSVPAITPTGATAPTPTLVPPTLPALARQDSPAGAESFARYYITVLDYAYQAGDTTTLRKLAECRGCDAVVDGIDRWTAAGGTYEGGRLRVLDSRTVRYAKSSAGLVRVAYSRSPRDLVSSEGISERVPGSPRLDVVITERMTGPGWLITNIQTVK